MAIQRSVVIRLVADVRGMSAGMDEAERSVTRLDRRVAAMTRAVRAAAAESAQASQRVAAAKRVEATMTERAAAAEQRATSVRAAASAAATRVGEAEARLEAVRSSGAASAAQIAAAEQQVTRARARHDAVTNAAASAEQRLTAAQELQARAAAQVTAAEERATAATNAHAAAAQRSIARTQAWNAAAGKMAMVGGTIGLGLGLAVKQFMDFDEAMGGVRANLTNMDVGKLPQLTAAVKEAGAASVYSSVEAANAAEELIKAGVSASEVIGGGLTGALGLAAAGGIGLARAAEVSAMAMTQFKLGGEDATHIADVLAGGALASTASVDSLAMALAQGGGVANQFGAHLEDTVGTLAMFDQNALRGSDAGTSMKTMLLSLANPSKAAAAAMRNLGINAFTAQGEFVGLAGLQDQLKEKTKGLTQEQRQQAFATIFGSDAVRAANAMYGDTKGIRAWTESVNKSGLASQVAAAKLNNAKGDLEALKGDLENILIGAGEGANGPIRGLIQNVDKLVSAFGELPPSVQSGVVQIAAFGSAGLLAAAGVIKMVNTIRSIRSGVMTASGALRDGVGAFTSWVRAGSSSGTMLAGLRGRAVQAGNAIRNMGVVGKVGLGMLAAGFIAAGVAAATSGREVENYGRQTERLGLDLQSAAKGGAGLNDIFKDMSVAAAKDSSMSFAEGMRSLKGATNEATDGVDRFAAGIFKQTGLAKGALGPIDAVKGRLEGVGRHLADLANNGNMAEASAQFKVLSDEAKKYGVDQKDLIRMMPEWSAVLDSSAYKQQSATEKAKADQAARQKQKEALDQLISAYKNLNNVLLQQEAGQDAALAAVDAADKALQENGRTLDANSEKGRANRSALRGIVQQYGEWASSVKQATGSSEQANAILAQGKKAYIDHAVSMGKSASEAKRLADELFKVGEVDTTADVNVKGVEAAKYEVDELGNSVVRLDGSKIEIPADTPNAPQVLQMLEAIKGTAYDASQQKLTVTAEAMKVPETKAAIESVPGIVHNKDGSVTVDVKQLGADVANKAIGELSNVARLANGQIVHIPAGTNAPAIKALIEGLGAKSVAVNGTKVQINTSAPLANADREKINKLKGAAVNANGTMVTIDSKALTAQALADIAAVLAAAKDKTNTITTVHRVINESVGNNQRAAAADRRDTSARGNVFLGAGAPVAFARGGVREDHEPQIARPTPGRVRVWAEPETQGEAYIPFANDGRRGRAKSITEYVARRFGGSVTWHADGSADDWTPDMSGIMAYAASLKVDPSAVADQRKKVADQSAALNKAIRDLKAAQAGVRGKSGAARVKAENAVATAMERQAKATQNLSAARSKLAGMEARLGQGAGRQFIGGISASNWTNKRFLDDIERIKKRGFPTVARSLLEDGSDTAVKAAHSLAAGARSELVVADRGLKFSDAQADRRKKMLDDLKGISSDGLAATAQQQANAQLLAMRGAQAQTYYASGTVQVSTTSLEARLDDLAKSVAAVARRPVQSETKLMLDSRQIAQAVATHVHDEGRRLDQWGQVQM